MSELTSHEVVVVDDGLASGFTMQAAVTALRLAGAKALIVAVPTGHENAIQRLAKAVDNICCVNVRGGASFAVAAAYLHWSDVSEAEAMQLLQESQDRHSLL
jgi:predicted phosphoribosyltransferase